MANHLRKKNRIRDGLHFFLVPPLIFIITHSVNHAFQPVLLFF
jgi:hypothetical protein